MIIRCGDGLIGCGLDKVRVFQQCVVPALKEFYMADADSRREALSQADIIEKLIYKVQQVASQPQGAAASSNDVEMI